MEQMSREQFKEVMSNVYRILENAYDVRAYLGWETQPEAIQELEDIALDLCFNQLMQGFSGQDWDDVYGAYISRIYEEPLKRDLNDYLTLTQEEYYEKQFGENSRHPEEWIEVIYKDGNRKAFNDIDTLYDILLTNAEGIIGIEHYTREV